MILRLTEIYEDGFGEKIQIVSMFHTDLDPEKTILSGIRLRDGTCRQFYVDGRSFGEEKGSKSLFNLRIKSIKQALPKEVQQNQKLTAFVYLLLRDHIPSGKVNKILDEIVNIPVLSDKNLEAMAKEIAERLG